jgi:cob(I)alamin adenosyltransferase
MSKKEAKEHAKNLRKGKEQNLFLLHTGNGKGKTSAAMNMVYRHLAHGYSVAIVQFVKKAGDFDDGDRKMLMHLKALGMDVEIETMGQGFTWDTQDPENDRKAALNALKKANEFLQSGKYKLVLLDELHISLSKNQLKTEEVLPVIKGRNSFTHIVTTGRNAPQELIEEADLVTEMKLVKHHISKKIPAQEGIEF